MTKEHTAYLVTDFQIATGTHLVTVKFLVIQFLMTPIKLRALLLMIVVYMQTYVCALRHVGLNCFSKAVSSN